MQKSSFLCFEVIWKDEHMIELEITASNVLFYGVTQVYEQFEDLITLSEQLSNFSLLSTPLFYECGERDSYSYFSVRFCPVVTSGTIGVQINMEQNIKATEYRQEEKSKLSLEILVEPAAIDEFCLFLKTMAEKQHGKAELRGRLN